VNARFKSFLKDYSFALFAPIAALLIVGLLQRSGWLQQLEDLTINLRFHLREPWDPPADSRLLLVGIDQQSLDYIGAWPWPRTVEADFLNSIATSDMNPRTVAFDLLIIDNFNQYHDPTGASAVDPDKLLGDAAGLLPSVITGAQTFDFIGSAEERRRVESASAEALKSPGPTQPITHVVGEVGKIDGSTVALLPVAPLRAQSLFGFVNDTAASVEGTHYRLPLVVRVGRTLYPSLSLQALCQILHVDADRVTVNVGRSIVLQNSSGKKWTIPVNDTGEITINYRNSSGFPSVNFKALFIALTSHNEHGTPIPPECNIDKKALLIGQVADGAAATDIGPTPLQARAPLVYTHFNVINDVLRGDYIRSVWWVWLVTGYLAACWLSLFALRHAGIAWSVGVPTVVICLYAILAVTVFWVWSIELAMAWPMIAYYVVSVARGIRLWYDEAASREQIKGVFSRMLSPEVMNHVLSNPDGLELGGTMRNVTILFSDIRDYTKISENIETGELVRQLNVYFGEMVECVTGHRGTFHKFIGDAVMAVWGDIAAVSGGVEADARGAVDAALEMRERLAMLNILRTADGLRPLRIGIGLNHGEVLVGQIGAAQRSEFTVIGDSVNVASRLEGMTKEFNTDLAIGESVEALLGDGYLTRRLGRIQLKGKSTPMMVYEVLGRRSQRDTTWSDEDLRTYHDAFDHFLARDFAPATAGFTECLKRHPNDSCVQRYLNASQEFHLTPPTEDWDGRVVMETK
jgi:adenylate cyclase